MRLSVVIPTLDRREQLLRTLAAIDAQRLDPRDELEIVVCDNGSQDGTVAALEAWAGASPLVVVQEIGSGAGGARNRALQEATGEVTLLLGDDTVPADPELAAGHLALHRERPDELYAVLGRYVWAPGTETPFMRWIDEAAFNFAFDRLAPGPVDARSYLYSSHVSLDTGLLRETGFRSELSRGDDTELGVRLHQRGLVLDYHPELVVHHFDVMDLDSFARRMEHNGRDARRLHELHPDDAPPQVLYPEAKWRLYPAAAAAARVLLRLGARGRLRERAWSAIVMRAYARGYREA